MASPPGTTLRRLLFVGFCACSVAIAVGYIALRRAPSARTSKGAGTDVKLADSLAVLGTRPGLLFTSAAYDGTNGFVAILPLGGPDSERYRTALRCERVHFARGVGLCLAAERAAISRFTAKTFGPDFQVRQTLPLRGVPSRARVSPDGRRGAVTVFVSGDSYNSGSFSTRTTILDMAAGQAIADLEEFAVTRAGTRFKAMDFNFWGVTFAQDGNRFFATLRSGGTNYLVEGNVDARTARVLREDVECPSLSPDNTRIVFKKRVSPSTWRLHVLDVATLVDVAVSETRSVDDQPEWLDDGSIAYMLPSNDSAAGGTDVWALSITGQAPPRILIARALSPVIVN